MVGMNTGNKKPAVAIKRQRARWREDDERTRADEPKSEELPSAMIAAACRGEGLYGRQDGGIRNARAHQQRRG